MLRALIDTNVVIDVFSKRRQFFDAAKKVFQLIEGKRFEACVTATTVTDIYYLSCRDNGREYTLDSLQKLLHVVRVLSVDREIIDTAFSSRVADFEDAVQVAAAHACGVECIVTRNTKDFIDSGLIVYSPEDVVNIFPITDQYK